MSTDLIGPSTGSGRELVGPSTGSGIVLPRRILAGGSLARSVLAPIGFGVIFLGLWQALVTGLQIEPYVVPSPLEIAAEFGANISSVLSGATRTGLNALIGLVVGALLGVLGALLANVVMNLEGLTAPLVAALAVMPIVALAPVLYTMYGADVETARQLVAGIGGADPGLHQHPPRAAAGPAGAPRSDEGLRGDAPPAAARRHAPDRGAVPVHRAAGGVLPGGDLGAGGRVLRRTGRTGSASRSPVRRRAATTRSRGRTCSAPILLGLVFYAVTLAVEMWFTRHRS